MKMPGQWQGVGEIVAQTYICAFCDSTVSSVKGWLAMQLPQRKIVAAVQLCPSCWSPTYFDFFDEPKQKPSPLFGQPVPNLPVGVKELYQEARACTGARAFTAAVMVCRTILSHVAEEKGADPGVPFGACIDHLVANNWVPKNATTWADKIRKLGNAATHKLAIMNEEQAGEIVKFTQWLLKFVYEFEAAAPKPTS